MSGARRFVAEEEGRVLALLRASPVGMTVTDLADACDDPNARDRVEIALRNLLARGAVTRRPGYRKYVYGHESSLRESRYPTSFYTAVPGRKVAP